MKEIFTLNVKGLEIKIKKDNNGIVIEANKELEEKIKNYIKSLINTNTKNIRFVVVDDNKNNKKSIVPDSYFEDSKNLIKEIRDIVSKYDLPTNILEKIKNKIDKIAKDIDKLSK